jgi:HSP20 family molecular chaperone IbpA
MTEQELTSFKKQEVSGNEQIHPGRTYVPNVDIYESADSLWLRADMPGVDDQSLEVELADGVLSLFGRVSVKEYENVQPVYTEYNIGNYARRFTLSKDIDTDRISARMINGVLELQLPKAERAKPRRLAIATT